MADNEELLDDPDLEGFNELLVKEFYFFSCNIK
jgi:hypothetical protein